MSDTGRLTTLLEQYRDRLRTQGEEGEHEDDLSYLLQVLESPLMSEYLSGGGEVGGASLIQDMASVLEEDKSGVELSPRSQRKRSLARQASIRALKIALTPQSSPATTPRVSKTSQSMLHPPTNFPLLSQSVVATRYGPGSLPGSHETTPSPRNSREVTEIPVNYGGNHGDVDQSNHPYNIDHIYISPFTGKRESPVTMTTSPSPIDTDGPSHHNVLSNSTNTLIERTVTPYEEGKKYTIPGSGGSYGALRGLNSEDIRTPELGDSQDSDEFVIRPLRPSIDPSLGPAPSIGHTTNQLPLLPSYNEALNSQNRVKSYEDLLNDKPSDPMYLPPTIQTPDPAPVATPTQPSPKIPSNTQTPPTLSNGRLITLNLVKGPQGLGFRVNKTRNAKKGELCIFVQEIQPGGVADRVGICRGDYLVGINKQRLTGISPSTAVSLLQQAKGNVEIVLYRKEGVSHEGSPSPTMLPPGLGTDPTHPVTAKTKTNLSSSRLLQLEPRSSLSPPPVGPLPPPPQFMHPSSIVPNPSPPSSPKAPPTVPPPYSQVNSKLSTSITPPTPILHTPPPHISNAPPTNASPLSLSNAPPPPISTSTRTDYINQSSSSNHNATPTSIKTTPTLINQPLSPKITELVSIMLVNNQQTGFGFSMVTQPNNGGTFVKSIVPNGLAYRDGRLASGDRIVLVNGYPVEGMSHQEVSSLLKDTGRAGQDLTLVVARAKVKREEHSEDELASDTDSSDEYEDHEVELVKPVGQGLGIAINALVNDETGVDKGIFIKSVNPGGPARLSGCVQVKDRIIGVDGIDLRSLPNMEAAGHLRNSGRVVHLVLRRHTPSRYFRVTTLKGSGEVPLVAEGNATPHKYSKTGQEEEQREWAEPDGGVANESPLSDEDELIRQRWRERIPADKTIRVAHITRSDVTASIGITMETMFMCNDTGQPQGEDIRHVIQSITPGGLVDHTHSLMVDDELLEVNGNSLWGVSHDQAIKLVQSTSKDVTIVVCRLRREEMGGVNSKATPIEKDIRINSGDGSNFNPLVTTSESEDDHRSNSASSSSPALHSIYLTSTIPDFSRRFERLSWRERHAELTTKLTERFEIRRKEYYRDLTDRIDELEKGNHELELRNKEQLDNEEERAEHEGEGPRGSLQFDYSSYASPMGYYSPDPIDEVVVVEEPLPPNQRDSVASEGSSGGILSPVPGSGLWESEGIEVELQRGGEGLGFCILDFADPVNPGDKVNLVHSLVPGGTAHRDGRLQRGDKLISVNGVSVLNHTLEFTVEQLKSTAEDGLVHICVNHPVPDTPDINSTPNSFSPDHLSQLLRDQTLEEEEEGEGGGEESSEDDVKKREGMKRAATASRTKSDRHDDGYHDDEHPLNEDPLIAEWKDKRPVKDEEDYEPLPPYTEFDPLQSKGNLLRDRERRSSDIVSGRSLTPGVGGNHGNDNPRPILNRTRSDEQATRIGQGGPLLSQLGETIRMMESTSEETLVASCSNQDLHIASSQPSPKQHPSPQMRGRSFVTNGNTSAHEYMSQVATASPKSQEDSAHERASPDTSDTGDHSAEAEAEPRFIQIIKGANPLGMSLTEDNGFILVKKIDSSSVLGRDGRIRTGDRILSINGKSLDGVPISKVRSILKRASSNRSTKVSITYLPAPIPTSVGGVIETTNQITGPSHYSQSPAALPPHQPPYSIRQQVVPQPHPMIHPHMGHNLPGIIPSSYQPWLPGQPLGYNSTPAIQTRPPVHTSYHLEQPVPIKPPPPPYQMYPPGHMTPSAQPQYHWNVPGMEYQTQGGGAGQMNWNMGLQNPSLHYMGGDYPQFQGNQQQQVPPMHKYTPLDTPGNHVDQLHLLSHPPHQSYQPQDPAYHHYMQYKQLEDQANGRQTNKGEWKVGGAQHHDSYSAHRKGAGHLEPKGSPRVVEVKRDTNGSLGISLGLPEGGIEGVVIIDLSPACNAMNKGRLLLGDRILEVNGHNLRHSTQSEAVSIIKHSTGPVKMLVQSYCGYRHRFQTSPSHSNDGSWAIDEEEDEHLRQMFPNVNGYLFEVTLNKGNGALGLSICKNNQTQSVVVMQVQPGGLADLIARIKQGDEILKVNEQCVIGWSHENVSRLLKQSPPCVKMILVRPLPVPINSAHLATQAGVQNLQHKLDVLQEQQQREDVAMAGKGVVALKEASVEEGGGSKTSSIVDMTGLPLVKAITIDRDDDVGMGFTVAEGEFQGEVRVVVSTIVPNGPADKEGQLMLGDSIISIDGHKVIGAKYEKATHLLQQGRSRGSVNLIVSSQTKLPSQLMDKIETKPHKRRNMGEKRKRVRSEGVTLRNKITKKPQLQSKRRPVSVDCEINYDLSAIPRISSNGGAARGEGSSSSSHSNRNSRVLSELEMRQGVEHFTSPAIDQEIRPGKLSTIEIFRGNQALGISIVGGVDSYQEGIIVHKVHSGTPAAVDGRLKSGDRIIRVGHTPVDTATKDEVIKMIMETQSVVHLTIFRATGDDKPVTEPETETVELIKPEQRGLGLMIIEDNIGAVIVSDVVEGEAAAFTSRIFKGDMILAINGEDIKTAGRDYAISLLQNCRGKVSLSVQHLGEECLGKEVSIDSTVSDSHTHYSAHRGEFSSPIRGGTRKLRSYHSPSPPINGALPHLHEHAPYGAPPPSTDSRGTTPLRSNHSFGDDDSSTHQYQLNRYRDMVGQSIPDSTHLGHEELKHAQQRRNIRVVHLQRGPAGLGFSIVGGKDSPNGDLPICVRTVSQDSVAGKEGLLRPGDVIVAVNGVSFENCTHQVAVETLKRCSNNIVLSVCTS